MTEVLPNLPQDIAPGGGGSIPVTSHRAGGSPRRRQRRTSLSARGEPMLWLTGGCVALAVLMIVGLLALIVWQGFGTFWPRPLVRVTLASGKVVLGEPTRAESFTYTKELPAGAAPDSGPGMRSEVVRVDEATGKQTVRYTVDRTLYQTGNFDITGEDFTWVNAPDVASTDRPRWGLVIERVGWGRAYGLLESVTVDGRTFDGPEAAWAKFNEVHGPMRALVKDLYALERDEMGEVAKQQSELDLSSRAIQMKHGDRSPEYAAHKREIEQRRRELETRMAALRQRAAELRKKTSAARLVVRAAGGEVVPADRAKPNEPMLVAQVVRAYPANQLDSGGRAGVYVSRWGEYLGDDPREANTEGGVYPAIIGTVLLTFIMILFVVPIGVIAAIYLREYAKQGLIVSMVRVSVNNLAGVPSIVFGVFGLGFFCYIVGGYLDHGPLRPLASGTWIAVVLLALLTIGTAAGATVFQSVLSRGSTGREGSAPPLWLRITVFKLWLASGLLVLLLIGKTPFFHGFFPVEAALGTPVLKKSALIWASLTLALLTLPVVIVATEEALAAVPRSMREGSYACGASKWQTIRRIVLPRAMPGIMTGMILAIARGAGEVAPLMLVGAVKIAPDLPISADPPLFGLNRSFLHLGFHIFDLGFQSRNSEAAKSMVYTTTLLLIVLVVTLNVAAIAIRSRLRRAYSGGQF